MGLRREVQTGPRGPENADVPRCSKMEIRERLQCSLWCSHFPTMLGFTQGASLDGKRSGVNTGPV